VGSLIAYSVAEVRRFTQPRGARFVLMSCLTLVVLVLVVQAARGQEPSLRDDLGGALTGAGTALAFLAVAAGASAVAKEHSSGALVMLLTWEPRRARVVLGKSFAAGAANGIAALVIASSLVSGLAITSAFSGASMSIDGSWTSSHLAQVGWLCLGTAAGGFLGFAVTLVTRSAALTLALFVLLYLLGERALDVVAPTAAERGPASIVVRLASGADGLFRLHIASSTACWRMLVWLAVVVTISIAVFRIREAR
jgi:hypothetical protein